MGGLSLFILRMSLLLAVLAGFLVWALVDDRGSPNHRGGLFGSLLYWVLLSVSVSWVVIALGSGGLKSLERPRTGDGSGEERVE